MINCSCEEYFDSTSSPFELRFPDKLYTAPFAAEHGLSPEFTEQDWLVSVVCCRYASIQVFIEMIPRFVDVCHSVGANYCHFLGSKNEPI